MATSANFVESIMTKIDGAGTTFTETAYKAFGAEVSAVMTAALTLYVAWWGFLVLTGRSPIGLGDVVWRVSRVFVIYAFAMSWSTFDAYVYSWASVAPDRLGTSLMQSLSTASGTTFVGGPGQSLSETWAVSSDAIGAMAAKGGFTSMGPWLIAAIVWVAATIFFAICIAILIFAKLVLWLLLGLAPLFIALALFESTRNYFDGWVRATLNHFLIPVILYALMAFFVVLIQDAVTAVDAAVENDDITLKVVAPYFLVCVIGTFIVSQVPTISQAITGSVSTSAGSMVRGMTGMAASALGTAGQISKIADHRIAKGAGFDRIVRARAGLGIDKNMKNMALARAINNASSQTPKSNDQ